MRHTSFVVAPIAQHAFFEQTEFERVIRLYLLQFTRFKAQVLHLVGVCGTGCVASKPPLSCFHEVLRPFVVNALRDALTAAQFSDAILAPQPVQHDPDLLFR